MSDHVILNIAGVNKRFGGLQALTDVGIRIMQGQIYGLIGPNGAGKTTFFNVITGLYQPDSGTFELAGKAYSPSAPHDVARAGIARTFQNIRLFGEMSALENVMVGRHVRTKQGVLGARSCATGRRVKKSGRSASAPRSCSTSWASVSLPTARQSSCRTATSGAWKSRARWRPIRNCWRWTSPRPA